MVAALIAVCANAACANSSKTAIASETGGAGAAARTATKPEQPDLSVMVADMSNKNVDVDGRVGRALWVYNAPESDNAQRITALGVMAENMNAKDLPDDMRRRVEKLVAEEESKTH